MKNEYIFKEFIKEISLPSADECYEIKKEKRYIIIKKSTGEVIDDAQGYGYKSQQGAWKALYFKLNKEKIKDNAIKIHNWWKEHNELNKIIQNNLCWDAEDYYQYDKETRKSIDNGSRYINYISEYIKENNIKCDIPIKDLFKYRDSYNKLKLYKNKK